MFHLSIQARPGSPESIMDPELLHEAVPTWCRLAFRDHVAADAARAAAQASYPRLILRVVDDARLAELDAVAETRRIARRARHLVSSLRSACGGEEEAGYNRARDGRLREIVEQDTEDTEAGVWLAQVCADIRAFADEIDRTAPDRWEWESGARWCSGAKAATQDALEAVEALVKKRSRKSAAGPREVSA